MTHPGLQKQGEIEIGLTLKCPDAKFNVLSMTLTLLCWFSNWQGHIAENRVVNLWYQVTS